MNPIAFTLLKHRIESLKTKHGYGRPQTLSVDYVIDRIVYVLRTGCQWSNIPVQNGCWKTIYHYFSKWSKAHVFEHCYLDLLKFYIKRKGLSKSIIADTSFVKNIWGRDCVGKSPVDRGRKATKVSALVDSYGTPLQLLFHPGN